MLLHHVEDDEEVCREGIERVNYDDKKFRHRSMPSSKAPCGFVPKEQ